MRKLTPMYYVKQILKSGAVPEMTNNVAKMYAYYVDSYVRQIGHWAN